jgi:hypothetical protein
MIGEGIVRPAVKLFRIPPHELATALAPALWDISDMAS